MPSICSGKQHQERARALPPFLILAPYIAPPPPPYAHRIPPMPPPDVLDPDLEDEDLDLPLEENPDTGSAEEPEAPEEGTGGPPLVEDIRRRRNGTDDQDVWPSGPEKQRKPDVDGPVPQPETSRKPHSRLH